MEEDPESEWEIQEYSSSNKRETSMMKWILNKGYGIGKKMMITGIAISAAPLVLPPIVIFSAMGVAFSVPSGLVFATYACTNKLMRMLLPTPPSPVLLLEYYSDGDEQVKEEGVDVVIELEDGGDDCGKYVGASITNLDENIVGEGCCNENEEEKVQVAGYEEEGEGLIMNVDEIVVEKSYYTNENVDEKEIKDDVLPRENVIKEEEVEHMEDMKQEVEMRLGLDVASITNSAEDIVGKGFYDDDYKEEEVQPYDYKQEREALLVNVDEVDEKSYYTNENDDKKEMEDDVLRSENVTKEEEVEKIKDMKQEVEMRLGLDVGSITNSDDNSVGKGHIEEEVQPDDRKQEREALIMYEDEKSYNIGDVKAIEDDVLRRENFVKEEETEQMENIKQGVEMRLGLDVGSIKNSDENIVGEGSYDDVNKEVQADHYNKGGDTLLMNVDEIEDQKSNENGVENEMEDHVLQRENVTKEDETEQMEDIKQEVDTRLGLDVGLITNFGGGINEQGYEEDVGEYLQGDDSLGEENMGKDFFVESRMYENENNIQEDEKEELVEESTGLLEESASNVASKGVETIEPVIVKEIECEKLIHNGSKDNERVGEMRHVVILARGDEGNNFNSREVEELDLVASEVAGDSKKDGRNFKSDEKVMRESMGTQEKTVCDTMSNDGTEGTKKDNLISSNADAEEVGDESASMNFEDLEAGGEVKENGADESVDVLALPAFRRTALDTDNQEVTAENDTKLPTKESLQDILDDEKIWEKIEAMRAIVGYKIPSQPTCIEELKALYVFTGVEPPLSFNGNLGLDEVNEKLKFLMSIVGVK